MIIIGIIAITICGCDWEERTTSYRVDYIVSVIEKENEHQREAAVFHLSIIWTIITIKWSPILQINPLSSARLFCTYPWWWWWWWWSNVTSRAPFRSVKPPINMIKTILLNFMNCSCCFETRQERSLKTIWELFERRLCLQYIKNNGKGTLCVHICIYVYKYMCSPN